MVRAAALIAYAFALSSCERYNETAQQAEWSENQASANFERINALETEIADLNRRLDELQEREARLTDASIQDTDGLNDEVSRLTRNDEAFAQQIDYLRSFHGARPMPRD